MSLSKAGPDDCRDADGIRIEEPRSTRMHDTRRSAATGMATHLRRTSEIIANHHSTHGFKCPFALHGRSCFWPVCSPYDSLFLLLASCRPSCVGSSSPKISTSKARPVSCIRHPRSRQHLNRSQSSISISLRRRMTTFTSKLHFRRGRGRPSSKAISHISRVSHGTALLAARHRLHLQISVLPAASGDVLVLSPGWMWSALIRLSHLPSRACPGCSQAYQHTSSHPAHGPPSRRTPPAPAHSAHPHSCTPRPSPRTYSSRARHGSPDSRRARALRSRSHSSWRTSRARGCPSLHASRSASAPPRSSRSTARSSCPQTTRTLRAYPPAHGPSFVVALALALRSMRALSALTLLAFDAELLSAAPGTLTHLTLLADTLPYACFDGFLAAPVRARLTHLALPHFVGVPPAAQDVPSAAVPRLAVLDSSPGLAAALAPGRPLRRVTLHIASTLYDGLRPAALFGALGGALKELGLVLAPDVDVRTRGRLLGALGNTGAGLEVLELSLDGTSDEVRVGCPLSALSLTD
ncbi:hypothetical protein EDB85DRAFT_627354 [Lactarius pseudohatsudake]|nr:hypothetical protein EDB85DRAFT_627354 [Lactarius pseudohatsudake]